MPFRHWFAIVNIEGQEQRLGPFATRRTAERKAKERSGGRSAEISGRTSPYLVYNPGVGFHMDAGATRE